TLRHLMDSGPNKGPFRANCWFTSLCSVSFAKDRSSLPKFYRSFSIESGTARHYLRSWSLSSYCQQMVAHAHQGRFQLCPFENSQKSCSQLATAPKLVEAG